MPKITKSNLAVHNDNDKITISLSVLFGNVIEAENTHWSENSNLYGFFYLSSMRKFFLAVKKILKMVHEGVSNGQEGVSKWARGPILKSRTK